jgi:class 3 adenylate cyclase
MDDIGAVFDEVGADRAALVSTNEAALARPNEILASGALPPLVVGSDIGFVDRGEHELKGVPGTWRLFAVQ